MCISIPKHSRHNINILLMLRSSYNKKVCANRNLHTRKTQTSISYHTIIQFPSKKAHECRSPCFYLIDKNRTLILRKIFNYSVVTVLYQIQLNFATSIYHLIMLLCCKILKYLPLRPQNRIQNITDSYEKSES